MTAQTAGRRAGEPLTVGLRLTADHPDGHRRVGPAQLVEHAVDQLGRGRLVRAAGNHEQFDLHATIPAPAASFRMSRRWRTEQRRVGLPAAPKPRFRLMQAGVRCGWTRRVTVVRRTRDSVSTANKGEGSC
jgi:hypothetical protein